MNDVPIVYLVDDDPSVSKALKRLFHVAGFRFEAFETAHDFLQRSRFESPACLILDVHLPDQNGLDLQKELNGRGWHPSIVFITGHGSVPMAVEAMRSGAVHFLSKPFDNANLLAAVRQAIDRDREFHAHLEESQQLEARLASLTARERQVFLLVADGLANKNIATQLDLSLQTVKLHRGRVMQKLHADSVADLVRLAEKIRSQGSGDRIQETHYVTPDSCRLNPD
jgi:FixJ family two-component response regulator